MEATELITQQESDRAALAWAQAKVRVRSIEAQEEEDDGSKSFLLETSDQPAQLKVLPERRAQLLSGVAGVARRFPNDVPQVLAVDAKMGWLLTATPVGTELSARRPEALRGQLMSSLASIQTRAQSDAAFLDVLPCFEPGEMPARLLAFLARRDVGGVAAVPPGGASFITEKSANRYLRLLQKRLPLLAEHIAGASALPRTLVHGDMRMHNGVVRDDGTCVVTDWDECAAGPAGTCLHSTFDGCTKPAILLSRWAKTGTPIDSEEGRLLAKYVQGLVVGGYASEAALLSGLPGAVCAGLIRTIVNFEQFPAMAGSRHVSVRMHERLEDLLNLCDWLSTRDHARAMDMVDDYELHGQYHGDYVRARKILQDQVARHPERADLCGRFGVLSRRLGQTDMAAEACAEATRLDPSNPTWWLELARACLEKADLEGCRKGLDQALAVDAAHDAVVALKQRLEEFTTIVDKAAQPGGWPQVAIPEAERLAGRMSPERVSLVAMLFKKYGVLQVDNVFDPAYIASLHQEFLQRYASQLDEKSQGDNLVVGDKRFMVTMEMEGQFGSPDFYASGLLLPALKRILGDDLILNSYTTVISLPGAELQHVHKDHTALFESEGGWHMGLPTFVMQAIVPLIPLNLTVGTTRCVMGSQNLNWDEVEDMPYFEPIVPAGSLFMIDYATVHYGTPNLSKLVRPITCLGYARPWFRDFLNYNLQAPMQFTSGYLKAQREEIQKLLNWRDAERRNANREPI